MSDDKKGKDEYPKLSGNDKRWKQQEEFDSSGLQRQLEDDDKNQTISKPETSTPDTPPRED